MSDRWHPGPRHVHCAAGQCEDTGLPAEDRTDVPDLLTTDGGTGVAARAGGEAECRRREGRAVQTWLRRLGYRGE